MTLQKTLTRRVVLLGALTFGAFAPIPRLTAADKTPSSALVVAIAGTGQHGLAIIDPATNKVVGKVPIATTGGHPHEVTVSSDGKLAFVSTTNYGKIEEGEAEKVSPAAFIAVIDLAAQKELRRIETGLDSSPHGMFFAGGKLFYTAEGYQVIGRYDVATNKIDAMFGMSQIGIHMIVATKDTTRVFSSAGISDSVIVIEPKAIPPESVTSGSHPGYARPYRHFSMHPWTSTVIPSGQGPEGIAMTPDEKEVWTTNRFSNSVTIIDVATKKVTETLDLKATDPLRVIFTPDGKRVVIICKNGDVLLLDAATRKEITRKLKVGKDLHGQAMTPDSSRLYVGDRVDSKVYIFDTKTLESTRFDLGPRPEGVAWAEAR